VALGTLLGLILCNVIWSAHPAMGKLVLLGFLPEQAAFLRYSTALLAYSLGWLVLRTLPSTRARFRRQPFLIPSGRREWTLLGLLGFSAFCFSPLLQMTGLAASRAMDNSLIVAMEPMVTVGLAWLVLREKLTWVQKIAFFVAILGFALLTGLSPSRFSGGWDAHLIGNLLLLSSLIGEAMYSIVGRKLIFRHPPAMVFGSALIVGVCFLTLAALCLSGLPTASSIIHMPWQSAIGLFWVGPLGTGLSYLFWITALKKVPVASLALTLFIQPLLGPIWGAVFLGERLTLPQSLGSALILCAVFGQTWFELRFRVAVRRNERI
jgi:drug/metabolite transporter (DMT)-like permease